MSIDMNLFPLFFDALLNCDWAGDYQDWQRNLQTLDAQVTDFAGRNPLGFDLSPESDTPLTLSCTLLSEEVEELDELEFDALDQTMTTQYEQLKTFLTQALGPPKYEGPETQPPRFYGQFVDFGVLWAHSQGQFALISVQADTELPMEIKLLLWPPIFSV